VNSLPGRLATIDLVTIKSRQRVAWGSGDYAIVGTTLQIVGEMLCEAVDLRSSQRVLDVAAGNGNATLAAARRYADVVSTDYVGTLLERGRERAKAERLPVTFQEADAEALPFADGRFDVVLSTFGVMFTPDQQQAASELMRVCRANGKIGLANWTPESFIGELLNTIGKYVPPAPGVKSPPYGAAEPVSMRCSVRTGPSRPKAKTLSSATDRSSIGSKCSAATTARS
jgi:SAM-dependent methyltransferase